MVTCGVYFLVNNLEEDLKAFYAKLRNISENYINQNMKEINHNFIKQEWEEINLYYYRVLKELPWEGT
ncbi:hypothetical protein HMPREF9193_01241 [Treponema lecithinolyticum ATCC 700332]|uniref:Uncharacterized protein n=1 Tax=Treponema lecithinolyticum ATCC 700332 TaxID=1321815 RepID=A0ABN0NYZ1_TRELE|nr:hypothetical protein HMPREF9193_01241 [Treponema lecithinolyticum ATCC 700332]